MGAEHGSEVTVVHSVLFHVVRLRSDLGNDTGTVFLKKNQNKQKHIL